MATEVRPVPTVREVATLIRDAADFTTVEAAVAALPAEQVFVYLRRCQQVSELVAPWVKALELRAVLDGRSGEHVTVDGEEFAFIGSQRKGYRDIGDLLEALKPFVGARVIVDAVSDFRVTDIREHTRPEDMEKVEGILDEYRIPKGERGAPHLVSVADIEKYKRPK